MAKKTHVNLAETVKAFNWLKIMYFVYSPQVRLLLYVARFLVIGRTMLQNICGKGATAAVRTATILQENKRSKARFI
jgi:hypothetical protein